jgi:hypothetical protein
MGSFAVVAIMVGKAVSTHSGPQLHIPSGNSTDTNFDEIVSYTPLQVASVLCLIVGTIHVRNLNLRV